MLMTAKKFPNQSLYAITLYGAANFSTYCDAKSSRTATLFMNQNNEMSSVRFSTGPANLLKLPATSQSHIRRKTVKTSRRHRQSQSVIWWEL